MAAGLEVKNDNGQYLIDGTYENLALVSSRKVFLSQGDQITVSYTGDSPFIALGDTGGLDVGLWWVDVNGGTYNFQLVAPDGSGEVQVYIFDTPPEPSGYSGLTVYNSSGVVVFQSELGYMRPYEFINYDNLSETINKSYSTKVAVVFGMVTSLVVPRTPPETEGIMIAMTVRVSGGNVAVGSRVLGYLAGYIGPVTEVYNSSSVMVCNASTF